MSSNDAGELPILPDKGALRDVARCPKRMLVAHRSSQLADEKASTPHPVVRCVRRLSLFVIVVDVVSQRGQRGQGGALDLGVLHLLVAII